jgi:hypothetical protein
MARIRNIKPEFFDDEELAEVPPVTRLLFVGLWTQADREGRLEDRPERLRVRLFPYDQDITATSLAGMLTELDAHGFIHRYTVKGQRLIQIRTFAKHQYISKREPESELPDESQSDPAESQPSLIPVLDQSQPGTVDIGHRTRDIGQGTQDKAADAARPSPQAFADAWNEDTTPPIARCRELTDKRRKQAVARLRERPIDEWRHIFQRINASDFCRGQNDRGWIATFDWVLQPDTAAKVLEGKYDNRTKVVSAAETRAANLKREREAWLNRNKGASDDAA